MLIPHTEDKYVKQAQYANNGLTIIMTTTSCFAYMALNLKTIKSVTEKVSLIQYH